MKKVLMTALVVTLFFVGVYTVNAQSDFSNASYQFVNRNNNGKEVAFFDLAITGISVEENAKYSVHFSDDRSENVTVNSKFVKAEIVSNNSLKVDGFMSEEVIEVIETAGDIYVWVKEVAGEDARLVASGVKVNRPELMLSTRFLTQFQYERTSIAALYPSINNYEGRTVTYKMGRVTDMSLVRALNTKDQNALKAALQRLYNYAKADTNPYKQGNLNFGESASITRYMEDLVDDAYYYVYLSYKDSNGVYQSFDDVNLYQALNCSLNPNLNDMYMEEFHWPEEEKHYCEIIDGKYFDASGNEVDENAYNNSCNPKCKIVNGKYFDKNGKEVNKSEYEASCTVQEPEKLICKVDGDKYYGKDGNLVEKDVYEKECNPKENPKCEIVGDKYYDKDGNLVDKENYDKSCGTIDNPNTGVNFGLGLAFVAIIVGVGVYTSIQNKNKFPQA